MVHRIEVGMKSDMRDPAGERTREQLQEDLDITVEDVRVIDVYTIQGDLNDDELEQVRAQLFTDPVIQKSTLNEPLADDYQFLIEVGFLPGVTDNIGKSAALGVADVIGRPLGETDGVYKSTQYAVRGDVNQNDCDSFARDLLANELIQHWVIHTPEEVQSSGEVTGLGLPIVTDVSDSEVHTVDLEIDDDSLVQLSKDNTYALELDEMKAIQNHYAQESTKTVRKELGLREKPTDIELEIIAQTWSEHCKHKIFAADIEYADSEGNTRKINGLFRNYVKATTDKVGEKVDWLVSVFDDNAGIIRFNERWNFALKAETHNSPSALDPYGGAITGIVGVNRDILGARPEPICH